MAFAVKRLCRHLIDACACPFRAAHLRAAISNAAVTEGGRSEGGRSDQVSSCKRCCFTVPSSASRESGKAMVSQPRTKQGCRELDRFWAPIAQFCPGLHQTPNAATFSVKPEEVPAIRCGWSDRLRIVPRGCQAWRYRYNRPLIGLVWFSFCGLHRAGWFACGARSLI